MRDFDQGYLFYMQLGRTLGHCLLACPCFLTDDIKSLTTWSADKLVLFNSLQFCLFFLVVTPSYFLLPHKYRWTLLLGASCAFYMSFVPAYILILLGTILIDYWVGLRIDASEGHRRKQWLWLSIAANVGILVLFKYLTFFTTILQDVGLLPSTLGTLHWLLPIGLSFHTLQAMGYTIEIYKRNQIPERHLGIFALYVLFYPQLVAGPIERPQQLLHQFRERHQFTYRMATNGLRLMLWGLFKKVVIADRLALVVDDVFAHPDTAMGPSVMVGALFFTLQIFCDFSGYTDIARGAAQIMGFRLMENFNYPYAAANIADFWRRWHISLSSWLRDYVYIPLGGNRLGFWRKQLNLAITFVISGLWHGANYTFVVWGALHAFYQFVHQLFLELTKDKDDDDQQLTPFVSDLLFPMLTFAGVVMAWIFFRANTVSDGVTMVINLFMGWNVDGVDQVLAMPFTIADWLINWALLLGMLGMSVGLQHRGFTSWLAIQGRFLRYGIYYGLILAIIFFGQTGSRSFIYFQF